MKQTWLNDWYTTKQLMKLLTNRYGLNQLGIKKLLQINGTRYNKLVKGEANFNVKEGQILTTVFAELEGRF